MRFKTKSGVTISNNTVQKRLQEEAMKRSKEMAEEQQQQQQQQQLLQQQQQVPKSQQPLEDGSVIGKFVKPKPPPPLKKPTAEIHPAFYYQENPYSQDNQAYFTQETNFSQEIHAENLGEIHAVQEMQVFENSMEELPKIKNIFSTSSRKEKPSSSHEKPSKSNPEYDSNIMSYLVGFFFAFSTFLYLFQVRLENVHCTPRQVSPNGTNVAMSAVFASAVPCLAPP